MAKNEQDENKSNPINGYAKYSALGFQMIAIIGIFAFAGYKIDQASNHNTKWVTALLALAGVFVSLFIIIKAVKN